MLSTSNFHNISSRRTYDRFIPRRQNTDIDMSHLLINYNNDSQTTTNNPDNYAFVNTAKQTLYAQNYRDTLKRSLLPNQQRVLEFSCNRQHKRMKVAPRSEFELKPWPVRSRPKPLLGPPSVFLDMPDLDLYLSHQVVDWGKRGYLAATYAGEVHVWHPEDKETKRVTNSQYDVKNCIKWNRKGTHFAISCGLGGIVIWDCESFKATATTKCPCWSLRSYRCVVTSMEWTSRDHLITGCSGGMICHWSPSLQSIRKGLNAHVGDVIAVKLSSGEKNLVSAGEDCQIKTWLWPELEPNAEMVFSTPTKAMDWHPWKDSLLAVGAYGHSAIWNVNKGEIVSYRNHPYPNCYVDCLTFNPLSAELVVSYHSDDHYLTVLKTLDCVVDELRNSFGRVPYLLWDHTGTKLATASAAEHLCIFDFFGTSTDVEKIYLRMKKKKLTTNMMETVNRIGHCIR